MDIASIVAPGSAAFAPPPDPDTDVSSVPAPSPPWPQHAAPSHPSLTDGSAIGCWYLVAFDGDTPVLHGSLRMTEDHGLLSVSGDLYRVPRGRPAFDLPASGTVLKTGDGWFPQPHRREYALHLRSLGGAVSETGLMVEARLFPWTTMQGYAATLRIGDFESSADTRLSLDLQPVHCAPPGAGSPGPVLAGSMVHAGRRLAIWAVRSASVPRALQLLIHEMEGREWAHDDTYNADLLTRIFRNGGVSLDIVRSEERIPADDNLIRSELDIMLQDRLARHDTDPLWALHLFLVSSLNWSGLDSAGEFGNIVGLMFDNIGRHRQGTAVFLDAKLESSVERLESRIDPSVKGKPIGRCPAPLLRTMAHEIGHSLGLKHAPVARAAELGLMNQTQELLRQVDPVTGPLFPFNALMDFDFGDRRNLSHRPDPEVCPGWGHWSAPPKGLAVKLQEAPGPVPAQVRDHVLDMRLSLRAANELAAPDAPSVIMRPFDLGEPVFLELTLRNVTAAPITVPASVTLVDGLTEIAIRYPEAVRRRLAAAQTLCGGQGTVILEPGEQHRHILQIHSSGDDPQFTRAGDHRVELAVRTVEYGWVEAPPVTASIRSDADLGRRALRITGQRDFCEAMALGYLATHRGIADTDRLLRQPAYPLGARISAGVLQIATFAESPATGKTRMSPMTPNARRVRTAIEWLRRSGVTKEVVVAVADAIDPMTVAHSAVAEVIGRNW